MRYVKMLALAAVAAGALMAFIGTGTASASVICSTTADPCPKGQDWPVGTVLDFSIPEKGSATLTETSGEPIDTCTTSTVEGKITKTGGGTGATETVTGHISKLTWENCTFPTKTLKMAALEVHKIAGTSNGTVTADKRAKTETEEEVVNTEVTINTVFFGSCIYTVPNGKDLGEITEGVAAPSKEAVATFKANAVAEKVTGSNFACPATAKWVATYVLTSPTGTTLSVSASSS